MNLAQSPHIPAEGNKPGPSDLGWLLSFATRGLFELIRARIAFARLEAKAIPKRNEAAKLAANARPDLHEADLARITYVLPRLSDRLPWRSDCLIQALAGQNWLSAKGTASEIRIGVENPADGEFGAHAWLVHNEQVITGGDIDRYHLLLSDSRLEDKANRKPEVKGGN